MELVTGYVTPVLRPGLAKWCHVSAISAASRLLCILVNMQPAGSCVHMSTCSQPAPVYTCQHAASGHMYIVDLSTCSQIRSFGQCLISCSAHAHTASGYVAAVADGNEVPQRQLKPAVLSVQLHHSWDGNCTVTSRLKPLLATSH